MAKFRADIIAQLGGQPSATQRALIDRAALLHLRLLLMDRASIRHDPMNEENSRLYIAFSDLLAKLLRQIGVASTASAEPRVAA